MKISQDPIELDHWDRDPLNNALSNLRPCSRSQNQANKGRITGKDLPKGVRKNGSGFSARISFEGKLQNIGTFTTIAEAEAAYTTKAQELYGEFARAA